LGALEKSLNLMRTFSSKAWQGITPVVFYWRPDIQDTFTAGNSIHVARPNYYTANLSFANATEDDGHIDYFSSVPQENGMHILLHEMFHVYQNKHESEAIDYADAVGWKYTKFADFFEYKFSDTEQALKNLYLIASLGIKIDYKQFLIVYASNKDFMSKYGLGITPTAPDSNPDWYINTSISEDFAESAAQYLESNMSIFSDDAKNAMGYDLNPKNMYSQNGVGSIDKRRRYFATLFQKGY
jgi:hypothetical protein